MTTTQELITRKSRLKIYEKIEMKRRYPSGYESSWTDLTSYLLDASDVKVSSKLDFDSFGYGEFKTSNITFSMDNTQGYFENENALYSFFSNTLTRHYTKVRYSAGYYDENDDRIDEVVFTGLVNEKEINKNFMKGTVQFSALSLNQILYETFTQSGSLGSSYYFTDIVQVIAGQMSTFINYNAGYINPDSDIYIDIPSFYENRPISEVLTYLCQRANSAWYIDSNDYLVVRDRALNSNTAFEFIGGAGQKYSTNILNIEFYDEGFTKMINTVIYKTNSTYQYTSANDILARYGTMALDFDSEDITNATTIQSISEAIIAEWEMPRRRIILTTVYMPNILNYFDRCTIEYKPTLKVFNNKPTLHWNAGENFNDGKYWGVFSNQILIKNDRYYSYYGYEHDISKGITRHYLVESRFIGTGISAFIWNFGMWNNSENFNAVA